MLKIKNKLGFITVFVLSFLPLVFWLVMSPFASRIVNLSAILTSLGQISGLVGMAMFACVFVLSGRFKFLAGYFGGMNKVYDAHHFFGALSFILLLFHPLFLAGQYLLISVFSAADFILPGADWAINFGIFGLLFLILFLVITFFVKLPYQRWRLTHKFLGLAFFLAGLHSFLITSDISRSFSLRAYLLALTCIALLVYGYRTILSKILITKK